MNKHTPGPWFVNTAVSAKAGQPFKIDEFFVYAPNTQDDTAICADVIDPVTQEPSEANAILISAAPDLLAALQAALAVIEDYLEYDHDGDPWKEDARAMGEMDINDYQGDGRLESARAAIAKATKEPTA